MSSSRLSLGNSSAVSLIMSGNAATLIDREGPGSHTTSGLRDNGGSDSHMTRREEEKEDEEEEKEEEKEEENEVDLVKWGASSSNSWMGYFLGRPLFFATCAGDVPLPPTTPCAFNVSFSVIGNRLKSSVDVAHNPSELPKVPERDREVREKRGESEPTEEAGDCAELDVTLLSNVSVRFLNVCFPIPERSRGLTDCGGKEGNISTSAGNIRHRLLL